MDTDRIQPMGINTSTHGYPALDPNTYTAGRLQHTTPEHLHLTTRRFFIGPIPEGWLNSNRKTWYKRRLELSRYSTRAASFNAADYNVHHRTLTGLDGPSTAARMSFSFPQPADIEDDIDGETTQVDETEEDTEEDDDDQVETTAVEPVNTYEEAHTLETAEQDNHAKVLPVPPGRGLEVPKDDTTASPDDSKDRFSKSPAPETFVTARQQESPDVPSRSATEMETHQESSSNAPQNDAIDQTVSTTNRDNPSANVSSTNGSPYPGEMGSKTALLQPESPKALPRPAVPEDQTLHEHEPAPTEAADSPEPAKRTTTGVRFSMGDRMLDQMADQEQRIRKRIDTAKNQISRNTGFGRNTLQEGAIVKMEKMLVRVDVTKQEMPPEYDENDSRKTETRTIEKWREFMVVVRKSATADAEDFRLQMYKTRVIPDIDSGQTKKRPAREIRLDPKTTKVNLYSTLDKTVVIWHPYREGTRITIMRPRSTADSVEWYTFLRDALGWKRTKVLQVGVPDLDVSLRLENPFEGLEAAGLEATDAESAITKTMQAEQAAAGRIIKICTDMLEDDPEWTGVLQKWSETAKMGLAWKRYDRLEWIHGANEQRMYGTMAMQQSYDLELRPKEHYPTCTAGPKGTNHHEPVPIEGFLIRLTSQKGVHKRMGRTFYKRLYYSTNNHLLTFNRPAKATPPHPPRLATISGTNIPSSHEIVEKSPLTYEIEPFQFRDGEIPWLKSTNHETVSRHDSEALEESRRCMANLDACDGYINMCHIVKVRPVDWSASSADEEMDDGGGDNDVDFHEDVANTSRPDGTTKSIDNDRVFELVLDNQLVIRLQAYNSQMRDEWIRRLRQLVRYWKLRKTADMNLFKVVRHANLKNLNIDEKMEAFVGQFARKWEVSRSEASPVLFHMCGIASCRQITMSGLLYRKSRLHSTFQRCGVVLAGGKLMVFQATVRKRNGQPIKTIQQEKQHVMDLKDCYIYSGLITEGDLLYTNTNVFDPNHPGIRALPRVYLRDGWTSSDEDTMTTFVVWQPTKKGLFRAIVGGEGDEVGEETIKHKMRRVSKLGVPGRGVVFKCRSRAERDHWVLGVELEIDRLVEGRAVEARLMNEKEKKKKTKKG